MVVVVPTAACAPSVPPTSESTSSAQPAVHTTTGIPVPERVAIQAIGLDEPLVELGLLTDGQMEVPSDYDDVGWFAGGGRPGGHGPSVLAGHVDSTTGPAVFDGLRRLSWGDVVAITSAAGEEAHYRVTSTGEFSKDDFPTVDVFGATAADTVRLITCSGDFDAAVGSYDRNYVVFGERI